MGKLEADVIVIAAGASGLTAALAAAQGGAKVIVLEKGATTGGTGSMGMGPFGVESRLQRLKQRVLEAQAVFCPRNGEPHLIGPGAVDADGPYGTRIEGGRTHQAHDVRGRPREEQRPVHQRDAVGYAACANELPGEAYKSVVYDAGADHVTIADTFGFGLPWTVSHLVRKVREWVPGVPVEKHAHNDWGMTTSVMLSAVIGGGYGYVPGKMSGTEIVGTKLAELGLQADKEQTAVILERAKEEAGIRKWSVPDEVFEDIARRVLTTPEGA